MLVSKEDSQEQPNNKVSHPVCPNCGAARESVLEQVPSVTSYVLSFVSMFYFGIWSLFIIPLIFQSTKIIIKRCYYCNVEIESRKLFQIPNINDKVLQIKFGGCMLVVSRKYAVLLLTLTIVLYFYFEITKTEPIVPELQSANKTWIDFLELCGKFQFVENGVKARQNFQNIFKDKTVSWQGDFVQIKSNYDMNYPYHYWVYVKMEPTESTEEVPDLVLGVYNSLANIKQLQNSGKGQQFRFQAQFMDMGTEYNYHLLTLISMQILNDQPLQDIKHVNTFNLASDHIQKIKMDKLQLLNPELKKKIHQYKKLKPIIEDDEEIQPVKDELQNQNEEQYVVTDEPQKETNVEQVIIESPEEMGLQTDKNLHPTEGIDESV